MRLNTFYAALLFALSVLTMILLRPLLPIDETRYVAAAWEIFNGSSPFVPHLNGALYTHKPPLLFWLIDLVWLANGVSTLAARLVAPGFAVASVIMTGMLARRLWHDDPDRAGRAALILAVSPVFLLFGSSTMFDSMLTAATMLAMLAMWSAIRDHSRRPWLLLGAAMALGVYGKGPVILVHIMPVALLMPLWADPAGRPALARWYKGLGLSVLVALLLVALWLVPALILGGEEYRTEVLWRQSAGRVVSSFAHQRPAWFFLAQLPLLIWPFGWTWGGLKSFSPRTLLGSAQSRMVALWFLSALLAFSMISGKQSHYLLPELPALALLLSAAAPRRQAKPLDLWMSVPAIACALVILAALFGQIPELESMGFSQPVLASLLGLAVIAIGIAGFLRLRSGLIGLAALPLAMMLGLHFAAQPLLFARYDMTPIAAAISPYRDKGIAVADGSYHAQFNYTARLTNPVARLRDADQIAAWLAQHPGGVLLSQKDDIPAGMRTAGVLPFRNDNYTMFVSSKATQ
ncbi:ArnT family glycosyltransferase [Paracoccus sp. (in: a-proteobacteria)]|uniref:ArnT family glycosyltransferase n=1 Tax=Paracoccus sp. TaxID=267 RepID=UPI003A87806A